MEKYLGILILITIWTSLFIALYGTFGVFNEENVLKYYCDRSYSKCFEGALNNRFKTSEISENHAKLLLLIKSKNKDLYKKILKEYNLREYRVVYTSLEYSFNKVYLVVGKNIFGGK
ncbi:MAG: hypothetical protein ACRCTZ_14820 [Sarcina sp.]